MLNVISGLLGAGAPPAPLTSYESIATVTLGSAASTVTFSSIPSTFKHLQIRWTAKSSRAALNDYMQIRLNGDTTGSNYRSHTLNGGGSAVYAETSANDLQVGGLPGNTNASMFGVGVIDILDYSNTSKNTTLRTLNGFDQNSASTGAAWVGIDSGLWMNTAAVSSVVFNSGTSSNFVTNTQFALYGIKG